MKRSILLSFGSIVLTVASGVSVFAQKETDQGFSVETDIDVLRRDLRAEGKKIIGLNMRLTAEEAAKFWPIYDEFMAETKKANDPYYGAVKEYLEKVKTITDPQAFELINRLTDAQMSTMQVRRKYLPIFEKVISGKRTALFFQIDQRLRAVGDVQILNQIPLVTQ